MTDHQCTILCNVDNDDFRLNAEYFGMEVAGPSLRGAFLVRDGESAFLFSAHRGMFGRSCLRSIWSPLNVAVMNREPIEEEVSR